MRIDYTTQDYNVISSNYFASIGAPIIIFPQKIESPLEREVRFKDFLDRAYAGKVKPVEKVFTG